MDGILTEQAERMALDMTNDERKAMITRLRELIADELAAPGDPGRCPRCGCPQRVRKGHDRDGGQRWLCRGCARTYSARTYGLLSGSKLGASAWMAFAECMADMLPLRETAARCGVSLYTAWFMRMRVCEVLGYRTERACRPGTYQVDGTYLVRSMKGNLTGSPFELGRRPHRNGQDGRRRGAECGGLHVMRPETGIVCGTNELGDVFCTVASEGRPSSSDCDIAISHAVPRGCTIVTDGHRSYSGLDRLGYRHVITDSRSIAMANALHSRLKSFLYRFRGVSTRRLGRYLAWFTYADMVRGQGADRRGLLFAAETEGRYLLSRRLTHSALWYVDVYYEKCTFPRYTKGIMSTVV